MEHSAHENHPSLMVTYNMNFQMDSSPSAGEPVDLSFVVTEQRVGEPIGSFELLHDRLMHLIIVDEQLAYFDHVHPILDNSVFRLPYTFPSAGSYKLWAEAKPAGADSVLAAFRVMVAEGSSSVPRTETVGTKGYQITLSPTNTVPLHEPIEFTFEVVDGKGEPVRDLEPLMAAAGHCVIINSDLRDFIHVHPEMDVESDWRGGPLVRFFTGFNRPGRYFVWGQFQHHGELITGGFVIDVTDGDHHSG